MKTRCLLLLYKSFANVLIREDKFMRAIADTERLVADGVITSKQVMKIEARARETMVYLAINTILCAGIAAAISGLIA